MLNKVSIAIVNYNGWRDTIECVESLLKSTYKDFSIIIVDNSTNDLSLENFKLWAQGKLCIYLNPGNKLKDKVFPLVKKTISIAFYNCSEDQFLKIDGDENARIYFIKSDKNSGYAGGNNIAIRFIREFSNSKYIWFLNSDTIVSKDALFKKMNYAAKKIGIIGSTVLYYYEPNKIQAIGGTKSFNFIPNNKNNYIYGDFDRNKVVLNKVQPIEGYVYGASMLVPIQIIDKIGLFDENYFMWYDEFDFCYRAKLAGFKFYAIPDSIIWHKEGGSTKDHDLNITDFETLKRFVVYGYYGTRNCLYLNKKFFNIYKFYFFIVPVLLFFLVKGCLRVIVKFRRNRFKRMGFLLLGFRDGIFGKMGMTIDIGSVK